MCTLSLLQLFLVRLHFYESVTSAFISHTVFVYPLRGTIPAYKTVAQTLIMHLYAFNMVYITHSHHTMLVVTSLIPRPSPGGCANTTLTFEVNVVLASAGRGPGNEARWFLYHRNMGKRVIYFKTTTTKGH